MYVQGDWLAGPVQAVGQSFLLLPAAHASDAFAVTAAGMMHIGLLLLWLVLLDVEPAQNSCTGET